MADNYRVTVNGGISLGRPCSIENAALLVVGALHARRAGGAVFVKPSKYGPQSITVELRHSSPAKSTNSVGEVVDHPSWVQSLLSITNLE